MKDGKDNMKDNMKENTIKVPLETNKPPHSGSSKTGTQSIERVVQMLRIVASRGKGGMRNKMVALHGAQMRTRQHFRPANTLPDAGRVSDL